ncbi:MAG: serine/threonine protein kinase [Myxococcales bacterium]|nr:serine/threonine protein kinase [Myxococcales bacterium]
MLLVRPGLDSQRIPTDFRSAAKNDDFPSSRLRSELQPVNVMVVTDESSGQQDLVKVLDFGIAKLSAESTSQTKSGVLMGTPTYMSPEQCRSGRNAVDRSDVYALGIIMYEMLAGATPFRGGPAALMIAHQTQDPAPLASKAPHVSAELCALIHRMLAKSPAERPTASEVVRSLSPQSGQMSQISQSHPLISSSIQAVAFQDLPTAIQGTNPASASLLGSIPRQRRGTLIGTAAALVLILGLGGLFVLLTMTGKGSGVSTSDLGMRKDAVIVPSDLGVPAGLSKPDPTKETGQSDPALHGKAERTSLNKGNRSKTKSGLRRSTK